MSKFEPMYDNILLKKIEEKETVVGGVFLTNSDTNLPNKAEVIAVGHGKLKDDGTYAPMITKVGDKVIYNKFVGSELKLDGENYLVVKESEILGILREE